MLSLAESTERLQETTEQLTGSTTTLTPQLGITLIDQWLDPLRAGENTQPMADTLQHLKELLNGSTIDEEAIRQAMGTLAEQTSILSSGMGSESEMPSLLDGLAAGLRQAGQTSKAD